MPPASAAVGGVRRFFDIAVPRNISSDVNDCGASAHVYNVDDLKEVWRVHCLKCCQLLRVRCRAMT